MALEIETLNLGPLDNNTYLLACPATGELAVVDPGFEPEAVIARVRARGGNVRWLLATHAHYDHVCGARAVQRAVGGTFALHPEDEFLLRALSQQGAVVGLPPAEAPDVGHALEDGEHVAIGAETVDVLHLPGHSPGHVGFRHGDVVLGGDVLFAGSIGRTDLPGGSFEALERSIRTRLFPLGDHVRVLPGHGPATTVGRERRSNPFVGEHAGLA
jgi:hydroxyacylglutathione hydrolase